jgi:hypothetical protein
MIVAHVMMQAIADFSFSTPVRIVNCHAEGKVGDVIISGVGAIPGATLWEQSRYLAQDQRLRNYVLREPRGGVFRHVNLLVKPLHLEARIGFIIKEPEDTSPSAKSPSQSSTKTGSPSATTLSRFSLKRLIARQPAPEVRPDSLFCIPTVNPLGYKLSDTRPSKL